MFKKQDLVIKLMNDEKDDTLARKDYTRNETLIKGRISTGFDALMWNGTFGPISSNSSNPKFALEAWNLSISAVY